MTLPSVRQQDTFEVRMSVEINAKHIKDFAFKPVGGGPDGDAGCDALGLRDLRFYAYTLVAGKRVKHPDHVKLLFALGVMYRCNVDAIIELLVVAEYLKNLWNKRLIDHHEVLAVMGQRLDAGTVLLFELRRHGRIPRHWRRPGGLRRRGMCGSWCSWFGYRSGRRGRGRSCRCCDGRLRSRNCRSLICRRHFCFGLRRAGRSSLHSAGNGGLVRRRLWIAFRRRGRRRFSFVRHSCECANLRPRAALNRTLTSISLENRCQRAW